MPTKGTKHYCSGKREPRGTLELGGDAVSTLQQKNYLFTQQFLSAVVVIVCMLNHFSVSNSATLRPAAPQAPLYVRVPRREYGSMLPLPSLGDLPKPGTKPVSPASPALAGRFFTMSATREAHFGYY